jgi:hypothetical protein
MLPMPSDFAIRLAGGLAALLLVTSRRAVPPAFFRTIGLVMLGLVVAAGLAAAGAVPRLVMGTIVGMAVLTYLASALWGLGLPMLAVPLTALIAAASVGLLVWASFPMESVPRPGQDTFNAASRLASAGLMGSTLAAMMLGHHYLTAPAMSIDPLTRYVLAMAVILPVRAILAGVGLVIALRSSSSGEGVGPMFLSMRWGMGVLGPAVATLLTWQTVKIRSTQSATGILYIGMTLVLFGELAGLILGRSAGVEL